jgi:glycerophosphoryl diester phosphodiesterase
MSGLFFFILLLTAILLKHFYWWTPRDTTRLYSRRPLYFAHRGALHRAPENTLPAYQAALDAGMPALELDVLATRDGKLVCSHNFDLERETDGFGYIDELNWEQVKTVNAAAKWGGEKVPLPLLEEVLAWVPEGAILDVEVKTRGVWDVKTAIKVARLIRESGLADRSLLTSFNPFALLAIRLLVPELLTGFVLEDQRMLSFVNLTHPDCLHPRADLVTPDLLRFAQERGLAVNAWTVNSKPAINWLLKNGVDGIITDRPEFCGTS